jgi:hypothetical protein
MRMLAEVEEAGLSDIISFLPHGRAFKIHTVVEFVSKVLPKYFKLSKWSSFVRQLNLYGFRRFNHGNHGTSQDHHGAYYHELFLRGRKGLLFCMRRAGVPKEGQCDRRKLVRKMERTPDFYSMNAML